MSELKWKKIGIVGGMGPRASADYYRYLIDLCANKYGAILDSDYPYVMMASLNADIIDALGRVNVNALVQGLDQTFGIFERIGISVIAIPCNSVFVHSALFPYRYDMQIIDLPQLILSELVQLRARDVMILCSHALRECHYYDKYMLPCGLRPNYPTVKFQNLIDHWIRDVMANKSCNEAAARLSEVVRKLTNRYDAVAIACTELSYLVGKSQLQLPNVINSSYLLANATLFAAES